MNNLEKASQSCQQIVNAVRGVFVGEELIIQKLLAGAMANGHVLFEDYPASGKTLLAKVFTRVIGCNYGRVQFTPDLLPADITGGKIWRPQDGRFELVKGRFLLTFCLQMKSTAHRRRLRLRSSKQWRNARSRLKARHWRWNALFSCWQRKTLSNRKVPTRCLKLNSTVL